MKMHYVCKQIRPSVFVLAKSLQLIMGNNATYKLLTNLLAGKTICLLIG